MRLYIEETDMKANMEKTFFVQLDNNRVKTISATDKVEAILKAKEEYEGAEITGIKEL